MKGLRDCTSFFVFVYGEFFFTLQIVVKLLQQMNGNIMKLNDSMLQISKNLEELKQCLVNDVDEPVHKNVPVHVKNYHFKTNVSYTLNVFQVAISLSLVHGSGLWSQNSKA